jgi:hypothetical protein
LRERRRIDLLEQSPPLTWNRLSLLIGEKSAAFAPPKRRLFAPIAPPFHRLFAAFVTPFSPQSAARVFSGWVLGWNYLIVKEQVRFSLTTLQLRCIHVYAATLGLFSARVRAAAAPLGHATATLLNGGLALLMSYGGYASGFADRGERVRVYRLITLSTALLANQLARIN